VGYILDIAATDTIMPARRPLAGVLATVAVALAYFVTARLGLLLLEPVDGVAVFWPAAGVASGILIAFGPEARWPVVIGVTVATIAANLLGDRNIASSVFFAAANAGEALIVAGLIQRFCGSPFELNELRKVLALFAATIAATSLSGIAGTIGFVVFHGSAAPVPEVWLHWFMSDALGTVAVAPLAIGLAALRRDFPPRREIAEGGLALALICIVCALLILLPNEPWTVVLAAGALCPLLLWGAARLRPAFTAFATFICAITLSGRPSSPSAFSAIFGCRSDSACWPRRQPWRRFRSARLFSPRCSASADVTKARCWNGKPGCRRRCARARWRGNPRSSPIAPNPASLPPQVMTCASHCRP
jgi:integral membrane sensor domain MASE1